MLRVRAIQVEHGDSLLVSYGIDNKLYHLLVDGGPSGSLRTVIEVLKDTCIDGRTRLEVLVVTHYDLDHIQGVIELLEEVPGWLDIGEVWFNGHHHLIPSDILGTREGDRLTKLICSLGISWNTSFRDQDSIQSGTAILQSSKVVSLPGGLEVRVLSPDHDGLMALAKHWTDPAAPVQDSRSTPRDLLGRSESWPPRRFALNGSSIFIPDTSIPNRSSIALLLTFDKKRVILAADAFSSVIERGLAVHLPGKEPVDLLKVSHHGSKGNTRKSLLDMLRCRKFLISTSGKIHQHPDHALMELLVASHDSPEIFFNYSQGWPGNWRIRPANWPDFQARYPKDGERFVDVLL